MRTARSSLVLVLLAALSSSVLAEEPAALVPPESLVADGLPKIPLSIAESVERYNNFRSARFSSWHPEKLEMLVATRFADTAQLHRVRSSLGARTQLTFFKDGVSAAAYPRHKGSYFVFGKDVGGAERHQLFRFDARNGAITLLTDGASRNSLGVFARTSNRLAYTSTRRNGKDTDLHVIDPADPASDKRVAEVEGGRWAPVDWSRDDKKLLVIEVVSVNESSLWLFDLESGVRTQVTKRTETEKVHYGSGATFAPDGKSLFTTSDKGGEFRRLVRLSLETGEASSLTSELEADVEELELSPDGKRLAFVTNEAGLGVLRVLAVETGAVELVPAPRGIASGLAWHQGGETLGFTISSCRSPADVYSWDVKGAKLERWTESETGGVDTTQFVEPELVHWKSFDERAISGFLYKPPARFPGKRPVVIEVHGGPEGQARPTFHGKWGYLQNELGVAIVTPNVRGSVGFGKTFTTLDNGVLREDSVKDMGALLDWIAARPDLDSTRVMVAGGSYGGYMALAVSIHYGDRIRCAVDSVGISNFVTFLERTEDYRRDLRRVEYGDERDPKVREVLIRISPTTNAARITKPLFVIQGKNDPRVPVTEAEQIVAAVRKNGTKVWYLLGKDEGHGFSKKRNAEFQFAATVAFVREYLLK